MATGDIPDFGTPIVPPNAESIFEPPNHTKSRDVPPGVKKVIGKLGNNRKPRGGPRPLKPEDRQKLEDYYTMIAWGLSPIKPKVSDAIMEQLPIGEPDEDGRTETATRAHQCAQAWYELAQQNDSVRRMVLMLVETGAWSKVMMLNAPIIVAALPDDALSRLMDRFIPSPVADDTTVIREDYAA